MLKCESSCSRFQPGEGPCRDLLCDCETYFKLREGSFSSLHSQDRRDLLVAVRLVPPDVHLPAAGVRGGVPAHLLEEPLQCSGSCD